MPRETFRQRFEVEVPARSLTGPSPSRELSFEFKLPPGYRVARGGPAAGARVANVNFGGLTERRREFTDIDNGVRLIWKLANGEVFPVTGRRAFMEVELDGDRIEQMAVSDKYRTLRQRFFDRFYFDGLVAEWVDTSVTGGKVKFADQTIYQGQALMELATEMAVLRGAGGSADDARGRIVPVMDAIDRLDRVAGPRFGGNEALDGFFVRDDMAGPNDPRLGGRFAACDSDWQFPDHENASPSGDQVFGLMFGLSAVVHFSGDAALVTRAKAISSRLYDYARRNKFVLRLPNGNATRRGADLRWLSSLLHGLNQDITGQDLFNQSEIEFAGVTLPLTPVAAFWDDPVTARQIAVLAGREFRIPVVNQEVELNSFALHIMLMALAPGDVWSQSELERVATKANHHLSALLYCVRHGRRVPGDFSRSDVDAILAACPDTGPRASVAPANGWNKDNRWVRSANLGEPSNGGTEEYNGVDWLVLYNLSQLTFLGG